MQLYYIRHRADYPGNPLERLCPLQNPHLGNEDAVQHRVFLCVYGLLEQICDRKD